MSEERKKATWPWIVALLIGPLVLYVLTFGPACWLCKCEVIGVRAVWLAYRPVVWTARHGPQPIRSLFYKYEAIFQGRCGAAADTVIDVHDQEEKLIRAQVSGCINAGYLDFDDLPGANSPIAYDLMAIYGFP
jgi:hypothetical protein